MPFRKSLAETSYLPAIVVHRLTSVTDFFAFACNYITEGTLAISYSWDALKT